MAKRRMLSLDVVDTDFFLDMPISTQNLYFHLSMRADDDGFVSSPVKIMGMCGANKNDLDILFAKAFLIPFENGVCVIKHWKVNNYIRGDRYTPTRYQKEYNSLSIENDIYTRSEANGNHLVYPGKVRLGKDSIDYIDSSISLETDKPKKENNTIKNIDAKFEEFRNIYPNKKGKANARILWAKIKGVDYDVIINACKLFAIENKGQDIKYIKHGNTWLSQQCWEDYKSIDREALKREMYNTWHEDTEDEPNTAHGKNMKDKYILFGENWYDIRMEDKQEVKHTKKQEKLLARSQPTQG